jgi:thymidylate synthase (FAD)
MKNNVRLIAKTVPCGEDFVQGCTGENLISYCARVSNPANQVNTLTTPKLLRYCIDHKHWSVFEVINLVMEITTTRDIGRQILRHRSFSFQEFSQRYGEPTVANNLGFTQREARLQDLKNRQSSLETNDEKLQESWLQKQDNIIISAEDAYKWALQQGIAKEQARAVLPEGLTLSRMYMNGTLRSWLHYCSLRCGEETQKEHRLIALKCWNILQKEFEFLQNYDWRELR